MNKLNAFLIFLIFALVISGVALNTIEKNSIDQSKLPEKVESNPNFQRWITNLKNKGLDEIEADKFVFKEENEIFNTKWVKVYSADDAQIIEEYSQKLVEHKDLKKVVYSPSERLYLDFRPEERDGYLPNEVSFYGQLDDKVLDARIVDCSTRSNCYFDRAYFIENEIFVITEISRNIDKKLDLIEECGADESCEYTFKLHFVDLKNNQRLVYESNAFDAVLDDLIPNL